MFVTPAQEQLARDTFGGLLAVPPIVDDRVGGAGVGRRALKALITGVDRPMASLVQQHGVEVMFEHARFFGARFPVPVLAWLPDFQHHYLPQLFSTAAWWKREIGFRAQTGGRRQVMLSSLTAKADCERFYPASRGRTHAARFVAEVDLAAVRARAETVRASYDLPDRFVYVPNHFWAHKNHAVLIKALHILQRRGEGLPLVALSGPTVDPRDPGLFERSLQGVADLGLSASFRHLGLIPYADVLALNAVAAVVINPSLFEGWATSVEEAKSLGTALILSDISVHREQAPEAAFFDPASAEALADHLARSGLSRAAPRAPDAELLAASDLRGQAFLAQFLAVAQAAAERGIQ
ncbi:MULTISPECIES: glycosyltransferase [unclassified Aurantimonas]|uniref:glycosyltransferase n=1 Tax=unclassified Aurantimonas TaxID=2638230 RepID=UPI002E1887EF|nr:MULTISPECIES: glycosyltransferase [unclassified Aurantimonas]MEC5292969.1 glycosyltransferase [Aurantimonas sp. C2-3-R2]MEC5414154.1 glycosyltransferase [Aurantimonas sp. C2-4-R8]